MTKKKFKDVVKSTLRKKNKQATKISVITQSDMKIHIKFNNLIEK